MGLCGPPLRLDDGGERAGSLCGTCARAELKPQFLTQIVFEDKDLDVVEATTALQHVTCVFRGTRWWGDAKFPPRTLDVYDVRAVGQVAVPTDDSGKMAKCVVEVGR